MIGRVLQSRAGQLALGGLMGVLIVLVGAAADSWRIAALGGAVALAVSLLFAGLTIVRDETGPPQPPFPGPPEAQDRSSAKPKVGKTHLTVADHRSGLLDEVRLARVVEESVRRLDLGSDIARRVAEDRVADRQEQADLVRLVTRHDTTPPLPVEARLPASALMTAVTAVLERRPSRVLTIAPGRAALWLARPALEVGGSLDVVCDPAEAPILSGFVARRGLDEGVRVLPCPTRPPEATAAVRPWVDLTDLTGTYDLVVVLPADAREARAAVPALDTVLPRLAAGGALLVAGPAGVTLLGPAWSARADLQSVGHELPQQGAPPAGNPTDEPFLLTRRAGVSDLGATAEVVG